MLKTLPK